MNEPTTETRPSETNATAATSPRLDEFEAEVQKLKITGGGANPERLGAQWGIGLTIVGFVVAVISWFSAQDATRNEVIFRSQIMAGIGLGIAMVGIVIWLRNSLTRYLRYWIIRLVFEQREQTDALIKALREK
jgi:hypothetical protein